VRLEKIAEEFGDAVSIEWKAFLLRPEPEERTMEDFRKYTEKWQGPAAQPEAGSFTTWSTDEPPPSHSMPPAIAAKAAARQGAAAFARFHHALMENYFHLNRNITTPENLVRIARETGLDVDAFVTAMADPATLNEVIDDHNEAVSCGINGVPAVIVDGRWKISGAQPREIYRRIIEMRRRGEDI
jgi:predicted DsbA family dithiol-disulfide isomerase